MVNDLYKAGYLKWFGISNYPAWQVALICELCERNGWKKPDIYQHSYQAIQRSVEPGLLLYLGYDGIAFGIFSSIPGRMLTEHKEANRFNPKKNAILSYFHKHYWIDSYVDALDVIKTVAQKLGMTTTAWAVRPTSPYSLMKREQGDATVMSVIGAAHLEENATIMKKRPLLEEIVKAFDKEGGSNDWIVPTEVEQHQINTPNKYFIPQKSMIQSIAIFWGMV